MAADGTGDKLDGGSQAAPTFPEVELLCTKLFEETVAVKDHYDHNEALKWNTKLVESITEGLVAMSRPFKYCVTCIVMEAGAKFGLNVSSTCFWDKQSDMSYSVRCESKNVIAVCTIFAVNCAEL
uniref:Dynein light chain n=1 Tax=Panagrolaimus davidi TaxID=227884 RepID=A0A914QQ41_9BILA